MAENNIGVSRLLGTNGLQAAVDSFTSEVKQVTGGLKSVVGSIAQLIGSNNRMSGSASANGYVWNASSNRNMYSANGGGGRFTITGHQRGSGANGGGGSFGNLGSGSRLSAGIGLALGTGAALVNYGNKNMGTNMLMDYIGTQGMVNGGFGTMNQQAVRNLVMQQAFANNYGATSIQDAARAFAITQYAAPGGNSQFNGSANPAFNSAFSQVKGLSYVNPALGETAAATAYQQTFSARSMMMGAAYGFNIRPGMTMGQIAQSIYNRTFQGRPVGVKNINAALGQNGSLNVNLQNLGAQFGWSSATQQEYGNLIRGQVLAQNKGMSASQYYNLVQQAGRGDTTAMATLSRTTGMGSSMFQTQMNLNDTRMARQEDILQSLAPAFDKATNAVNQFSKGLTALLQMTGLDKLIGGASGGLTPLSNAAGGFLNTLGIGGGLLSAYKLFSSGGGSGLLGAARGLFNSGASANLGARSASGVYNITTLAADASTGAATGTALGVGAAALPVAAGAGAFVLGADWLNNKALSNQYGVNIPSNYTQKDFDAYRAAKNTAMSQARGTWRFRAAQWERDYFKMNPAGSNGKNGAPSIIGYGRSGGGSSSVSGGSPANTQSNLGASDTQIIAFAKTQLGVPYVWGGESPGKGMDCSGLTQWAYAQAGVKIPRVAADQQNTGTAVNVNNTQPGDLLFVGNPAHHVVMNAGGGQIIEAPHTGLSVRMRALNPSEFDSATRIVGNIGSGSLNPQNPKATTLNQTSGNAGGDIGSYSATSELMNIMSALSAGLGGGVMPSQAGKTSNSATSSSSSGGAGNGSAGNGNGKNDTASLQAYAKQLLNQYGWGGEWDAFNNIVNSESSWNITATNGSSGAYGLPQALPGSKMSSAGSDWRTNGDTQLRWMMGYIKDRYGDPNNAWAFHQRNNWYDVGAWNIDKDQKAVVHQGEMIIPAQQAETIRQVLLNNSFNPNLRNNSSTGAKFEINVNVQLPNGYTGSQVEAKTTGKMIVDAITEDKRIKDLQRGQ